MHPEFTGSESPSDILELVLDRYSETSRSYSQIVYDGEVPYLVYTMPHNDPPVFIGRYRLDKILLGFFPQCEELFDHFAKADLVDEGERESLIRLIAFTAMSGMLDRLILLQLSLLEDNFHDTAVLSFATFLHALAKARQTPTTQEGVKKSIRNAVRVELNKRVKMTAKQKREFLIGFINTHPLLKIPTRVGRPDGSIKSPKQKEETAQKFADEIEVAVRNLYEKSNNIPTRTAVARFLKPGVNPKTGTDSRLSVFSKKVKHLNIDYEAIVKRVCGSTK